MAWGVLGDQKKSPGNVMNCPETNKKIVDPSHSGGVPRGIGGGGNISKVREIS